MSGKSEQLQEQIVEMFCVGLDIKVVTHVIGVRIVARIQRHNQNYLSRAPLQLLVQKHIFAYSAYYNGSHQ